jgi:hypothetical protein
MAEPAQPDTIIRAQQIGSRVALCFSGRVHGIYRQACNIETDHGTLVTLLSQGLGNIPHGIRCVLPAPVDFRARCMAGQTVVADGVDLRIVQAGMTVHLSRAAIWRYVPAACVVDPCADQTLRALLEVRSTLRKQAPASGFAPLLLRDDEPGSPLDQALQRRLRRTLPVLANATRSLDADGAAQALGQLAGLGPGLTPSGDDFIVGYLAALWSRCSYQSALRSFLAALGGPLQRFAARSNLISRQFLLDAVVGEFSESLADLVSALAVSDVGRALVSARRIVRIGHSSGADALTGLLFGLRPSLLIASGRADGGSAGEPARSRLAVVSALR